MSHLPVLPILLPMFMGALLLLIARTRLRMKRNLSLLATLLQVPLAMLLMLSFVALVAAVHEHAPPHRRIFSLAGLCAAVMAAAVLLITYFIQFSVMQLNLEKNQLDGWALLTQYNPNGIFIALEELAYLLMSLALLALAPARAPDDAEAQPLGHARVDLGVGAAREQRHHLVTARLDGRREQVLAVPEGGDGGRMVAHGVGDVVRPLGHPVGAEDELDRADEQADQQRLGEARLDDRPAHPAPQALERTRSGFGGARLGQG